MEKIKIGVSSCLLGKKVRYDGGHKWDRRLTEALGRYVKWTPVCPEVEYGLPVPRETMRLVGDPEAPRLVTVRTGVDHTEGMLRWAEGRLKRLEKEDLCGFVFKSKSPSSGLRRVKVHAPPAPPIQRGVGIFARAFREFFPLMPVEEDDRLRDPALRENFLERALVYQRWKRMERSGGSLEALVQFHTDHQLLILFHSARHRTLLGRLVAKAADWEGQALRQVYLHTLMEGLRLAATPRKNARVLQHLSGSLQKVLGAGERQQLREVIQLYRGGRVPLWVPIALLRHYVGKYGEPHLERQTYLHPHPLQLMLRDQD